MQNEDKKFWEIVDLEIRPFSNHPLSNKRDKTLFMETFARDLGINSDYRVYNKNNIFEFYFKNTKYLIYIELVDGGGKDKIESKKPEKKVSIPLNNNLISNLIKENANLLIVDLYIPLDSFGNPDYNNLVYLFVHEDQLKSNTKNPTSRWIYLDLILESIKNKSNLVNSSNNVDCIFKSNIKDYFKKLDRNKFNQNNDRLLKYLNNLNIEEFFDQSVEFYRKTDIDNLQKIRSIFKDNLIRNQGIKCQFNSCDINLDSSLIASHIRPFAEIAKDDNLTKIEKINQIIDHNNGLLLCANHDSLFDKHLISIDNNGKLLCSKKIKSFINTFNLVESSKVIDYMSKEMIYYLKFHQKEFKNREEI